MYTFPLIDGITLNGKHAKTVTLQLLTSDAGNEVNKFVDMQCLELIESEGTYPASAEHVQAIKKHMFFNEYVAASITLIGTEEVSYTFLDICNSGMSARDWNIISSATVAVKAHTDVPLDTPKH